MSMSLMNSSTDASEAFTSLLGVTWSNVAVSVSSEACSSLLKYDSIHGKFRTDIDFDDKHLIINKKKITFSQESDFQGVSCVQRDHMGNSMSIDNLLTKIVQA